MRMPKSIPVCETIIELIYMKRNVINFKRLCRNSRPELLPLLDDMLSEIDSLQEHLFYM